jgi:hypothetical protein
MELDKDISTVSLGGAVLGERAAARTGPVARTMAVMKSSVGFPTILPVH